jgi:hypothetical protein
MGVGLKGKEEETPFEAMRTFLTMITDSFLGCEANFEIGQGALLRGLRR